MMRFFVLTPKGCKDHKTGRYVSNPRRGAMIIAYGKIDQYDFKPRRGVRIIEM